MHNDERQCRKFNFTKKEIENLPQHSKKAASREQEYSDQQVIGLRILVSKNGRKFFHLRYNFNNRKRVISIGEFPAISIQEARDRANEYKNMLSRGLDPLIESRKESHSITFSEFVKKEYIPFAKENKKSWRDDVSKIENDMLPLFGNLPLSAITTRDVVRFQTKIKARTSASTSNRHFTLLMRILNLAIQWQFLEKNPCNGLKRFKEAGGKERYLNDEELKRFLSVLDQVEQSVSSYAIRFLLYTGLRLSEAMQLIWENIDFDSGTAFLPETKSGKSRTVILNGLAKDILTKMKALKRNEYVFPGVGPKGYLLTPRRAFEMVREMAGIENLRIHDLRHTFASIAVNNGANLYEVQKLLGHHSSQMTQRYAHLGDRELRAATDSVADSIGEAIR